MRFTPTPKKEPRVEIITGDLVVKPHHRFALVVAEFNSFITSKLAEGAIQTILRHGGNDSQITQVNVPGAFEIPTIAKVLALSNKYSAIICLGCVIKGQTDHYDHVTNQVATGVGAIGPDTGVPTLFGVITADTQEQALDRAGLKMGNTGAHATLAAIASISLLEKIRQTPPQ